MGCYKVLSMPLPFAKEGYKGLYRSEPFCYESGNKRFISLGERYDEYRALLKNMGITTELTIEELKEYADLAAQETGKPFEVIYFSEYKDCPHKSEYYGVDVTGVGGYSMVGEGFFTKGSSPVCDIFIQYFTERLNSYGLFHTYDDAANFRAVLMELETWRPGWLEDEDWRTLHIFKVL